jgi:hypothetical protein
LYIFAVAVCPTSLSLLAFLSDGIVDRTFAFAQAVLVCGVQTQALTFTFYDHATHLKVAVNVLFFISIVSSITGAYYALIATSTLEANLNQVKSLLGSKTDQELLDIARLPLSSLARRFVYRHCTDRRVVITKDDQQPSRVREDMLAGTTLEDLCLSIARNKVAGTLGVVVISLGFTACLAAFLCLACATQPRAVWITTVVVVSVLFAMRAFVQCIPVSYFQRRGRYVA